MATWHPFGDIQQLTVDRDLGKVRHGNVNLKSHLAGSWEADENVQKRENIEEIKKSLMINPKGISQFKWRTTYEQTKMSWWLRQ